MTDMTDQFRRLLEGLYLRTNQQTVEWRFDQSESICETKIGEGFVQIIQEADEEGDYYSYVRVLNSSRDVVDTIYGGSLGKNASPVNTAHPDYWELMRDLYSLAKRSALRADKVVDSIVSALGVSSLSIDDVPF